MKGEIQQLQFPGVNAFPRGFFNMGRGAYDTTGVKQTNKVPIHPPSKDFFLKKREKEPWKSSRQMENLVFQALEMLQSSENAFLLWGSGIQPNRRAGI